MTPKRLSSTHKLKILVNQLTGLEWRVGATQEPVFSVRGVYTFIISDDLESDDTAYACRVMFETNGNR